MHDPVFVVDDDPAARESVAALIRSHGWEAETFDSAEAFLAQFDRRRHGCLVVDVRMTGMSGVELQEHLKQEGVELPVIVITGYGDIPTAVQAMRGGARMFLEKPCNDQQLCESIFQALQAQAISRRQRELRTAIHGRLATLTGDEHRVLQSLLSGKPNKTIARDLDLGLRTVELRRATILQKMQASSLAELVRMVMLANEFQDFVESPSESTGESNAAEPIQGSANF
jgi:FixJ family two-component response regulator